MNKKRIVQLLSFFIGMIYLLSIHPVKAQQKDITPLLSLLLSSSTTMQEKTPSLAFIVAMDTDKIEVFWIPGSDGKTPVEQIKYNIYLSTSENFTPGPSNLRKTVTGTSQTRVQGLTPDTLYYCKVVAIYDTFISAPSNVLQTKTYQYPVVLDSSAVFEKASDLGLGRHTTSDGSTYVYSGGTPPADGSVLLSEDENGRMTLRMVNSSSTAGGVVTVYTSDASLTNIVDRGEIYTSFKLFNVANEADSLPATSNRITTATSFTRSDNSQYSRMEWRDRLLTAEQVNYVYDEEDFQLETKGSVSTFKLSVPQAVDSSFKATVSPIFKPEFITWAKWGGTVVKHLEKAKVGAKGTLSLTALAQYDFAAAGSVTKNIHLFKTTWTAVYAAGPVPVYQEITLSMDVKVSASASAKIKAEAEAEYSVSVEVGVKYNGSIWEPYVTHDKSKSLTASLDILGKANAEIRLIPKIAITFYKVATGSLTVEPFIQSSLTAEKTTDNVYFINAHPTRLVQLTSFDVSLGLEANVAANLSALGHTWDIYPSTCVWGTSNSCKIQFDALELFSIPKFELNKTTSTGAATGLNLKVTDGTSNPFADPSIEWEVFPNDGTITSGFCNDLGLGITNCTASVTFGTADSYTVFASGYGKFGEVGRQFKELTINEDCPNGPQTAMWKGREWQRCDQNYIYNWNSANTYCQNLVLGGHSDWRLPTLNELKDLVVCSNGCPTPIEFMYGEGHPWACGDGYGSYETPTIDEDTFPQCHEYYYWTSTIYIDPDPNPEEWWEYRYVVGFFRGDYTAMGDCFNCAYQAVRCIR